MKKPIKRKTSKVKGPAMAKKRAKIEEPDLIDGLDVVEQVLDPGYRKSFTLLIAIGVVIVSVIYGAHMFGDIIDTRARAAWATEYTEAKSKHEQIDMNLKGHEDRIGTLERQGQDIKGMLIEIKAGVNSQAADTLSIKTDVRDLQRRAESGRK